MSAHAQVICSSFTKRGFHVECSCGWMSSEGLTIDEAMAVLHRHADGFPPEGDDR